MEQKASWTANKHMLIMLACCLIPLGVLTAVFAFGIDLGSLGLFAIVLLCPLLHIFMMRGMGHEHSGGKADCHEAPKQVGATETTPAKRP